MSSEAKQRQPRQIRLLHSLPQLLRRLQRVLPPVLRYRSPRQKRHLHRLPCLEQKPLLPSYSLPLAYQ